ncbi:MAG: hypothetical protein J6M60_05440 [Clostridia bacterium]|nr:hypothetical protein [Clostridia bacterium]
MGVEDENRKLEQELKKIMNNTYKSFNEVLKEGYVTEEQKKQIEKKINDILDEYRKEYQKITEKMSGTKKDADIKIIESKVEKQIAELEKNYEIDKSESVQDFLKSIKNANLDENSNSYEEPNGEFKKDGADPRTKQEAELTDFMDESLENFDKLLDIQSTDDLDKNIIGKSVAKAIAIYENKFKDMSEKIDGRYRNPNILEKENQMKEKIEDLKSRYNIESKEEEKAKDETKNSDKEDIENIANKSQKAEGKFQINEYGEIIREEKESIRDEVGKQKQEKDIEKENERSQDEIVWNERFKDADSRVQEMSDGAKRKDETLKSIKEVKDKESQKQQYNEKEQKRIEQEEEEEEFMRRHGRRF